MICCGQEANTPFCPLCGTKLADGTKASLLEIAAYCRQHRSTAERNDKFLEERKHRRPSGKRAAHWARWEAAIQRAIEAIEKVTAAKG
jgi:hypothetical protein